MVHKLERAAQNVSRDFVKLAGQEIGQLFDEKLYPLADKLDYIAQERIKQLGDEIERLETKTITDIEALLNNADEKVNHALANINKSREEALSDVRKTIGRADTYLENRINQVSLVVMKALTLAQQITDKFTPDNIYTELVKPTFADLKVLEDRLFQDAAHIIDKVDVMTTGTIEELRNFMRRLVEHTLPNPFDPCRRRLNIAWKSGPSLSDFELYQLTECVELSKLNEKTPIDKILEIYGQLELNAWKMAALARNTKELKSRAIQDWLKYGVLCEFWRDTIKSYDSNERLVLEPQKPKRLLTGEGNDKNP